MVRASEVSAHCPYVMTLSDESKATSKAAEKGTSVHTVIANILKEDGSPISYGSPEIARIFSSPIEVSGLTVCKQTFTNMKETVQELRVMYGHALQISKNDILCISYTHKEGWDTTITLPELLSVNMFGKPQYVAIEYPMEGILCEQKVTGTADLILYVNGKLRIVDWKTTSRTPREPEHICDTNISDLEHLNYIDQTIIYGCLFYAMKGIPLQDFQTTLVYIVTTKSPKFICVSYEISKEFAEKRMTYLLKRNREPLHSNHCLMCFKRYECLKTWGAPIPPRIK